MLYIPSSAFHYICAKFKAVLDKERQLYALMCRLGLLYVVTGDSATFIIDNKKLFGDYDADEFRFRIVNDVFLIQ